MKRSLASSKRFLQKEATRYLLARRGGGVFADTKTDADTDRHKERGGGVGVWGGGGGEGGGGGGGGGGRGEADVFSRPRGTYTCNIYIYIYIHNHIHIKPIETISTKATQNTPSPCRKHGPFWTRHGVGGLSNILCHRIWPFEPLSAGVATSHSSW